jgi:flagellar basal body-associated protein FliL
MAEAQTVAAVPSAAKQRSKLPFILVAALMIVEGAAIFAAMKFFFGTEPAHSDAAEADPLAEPATHANAEPTTAEVELAECRPINAVTGKLITFKLRVSVLVLRTDVEKAEKLIKSNKDRITDRVNYIFRSAEMHHFAEPGLETVKRRIKHEVDAILADEHLIKEILIPEMLQSGSGL